MCYLHRIGLVSKYDFHFKKIRQNFRIEPIQRQSHKTMKPKHSQHTFSKFTATNIPRHFTIPPTKFQIQNSPIKTSSISHSANTRLAQLHLRIFLLTSRCTTFAHEPYEKNEIKAAFRGIPAIFMPTRPKRLRAQDAGSAHAHVHLVCAKMHSATGGKQCMFARGMSECIMHTCSYSASVF